MADTCYATAFAAAFESLRATTLLLAAFGENQATLDYPVSVFVAALERLRFPDGTANPVCRSYAWLRRELRKDTPTSSGRTCGPTGRRHCGAAHSEG
jgi:hypothetical protein